MGYIMKSKHIQSRTSTRLQTLCTVGLAAFATLAGLPVSAATTTFPQNPLLTGGNSIPPNILMILDDSGSMVSPWMTVDKNGVVDNYTLGDNVTDRSYQNNGLYYDPSKTYQPWRTASLDLSARLAAANFRSVASDAISTSASTIDLTDSGNEGETYFYVPNVANPGTTTSNYDKYRITSSNSGTSYNGGVVQKFTANSLLGPTTINSISKKNWSSCFVVTTSNAASITIQTSGGTGDGDLYAYDGNSNCSGGYSQVSQGSTNSESVTLQSPSSTVSFRIYAYAAVSNIVYNVTSSSWIDMTPSGNTAAAQQAQLQNFANWYQYHRTRNKMAKAGASEAFGRLSKNYRVGFDTIWNRGGATSNLAGSTPAFPIPVGVGGGLFEGANRSNFYSSLQSAGASNSTPLQGALQRAARYYKTDNPWKDSNGNLLTCRQNYAILTTDGYWNDTGGYNAVGNSDNVAAWAYRDGYTDTLADVAYEYWSKDLRTDMADNVLTSAADPAKWQHMVTFAVSIGQQGTLDPNSPPPSPWNVDPTTGGESAKRIDDLWHAALNGHGKFVVANNSDKFASALSAALTAIDSRSASGSNIASSSTKTDSSTLTFVAGFTSGTWLGDLIASPFNAALTGISTTPDWILSKTFATGGVNANFSSRTVLTSKGGTAALFNGSVAAASDFNVRTGQADAVNAADNIAYLKGDQSKEVGQTGGTLRKRAYPIGDIVDSSPAYVADTKTVYIGANDGMLHAINADSGSATRGKVLFSYVPKGIDFAAMANLSATSYDHRYFVDGQIDVISQADQGNNKNILVGALGRGGRGVYGLDVTSPSAMGTGNVLWDNTFNGSDITSEPNMGYVLGPVRIRKGNGGKTFAFVPNGIDSPNGSATLFVYELGTGGGIVNTTRLVADTGGNGLMSLGMADLNGDGTVDVVYGGDRKGNVWRWDFSDAGGALPASAVKLFQAKDALGNAQPISGGLGVGRDNTGAVFVGFGTGSFIASNDVPGVAPQLVQSLYGIKDTGITIAGRSNLQSRTIPFTGTVAGAPARGFETYSALPTDKQGWYIDLATPERVTSAPTVYGSAMYLSSVIPATGSDCQGATGSGFLNAVNIFTGTSPQSGSYFGGSGTVINGSGASGTVGGIGITGGMPTEANITSVLATVGTGVFTTENGGAGNTSSAQIPPPGGGTPTRVNWREIVPLQ
jgi:type IV pilus assembly protein PilY1